MAIKTLGGSRPVLYLFHSRTTLGWRVVRPIRFEQGERKVTCGSMRRVNDGAGNHIGYQILEAPAERGDKDITSQPSAVAISVSEMQVNAECTSRTEGMAEPRRLERLARIGEAEDLVERVQMKVKVYAHLGAAKGDILRVWPRNAAKPLAAGV